MLASPYLELDFTHSAPVPVLFPNWGNRMCGLRAVSVMSYAPHLLLGSLPHKQDRSPPLPLHHPFCCVLSTLLFLLCTSIHSGNWYFSPLVSWTSTWSVPICRALISATYFDDIVLLFTRPWSRYYYPPQFCKWWKGVSEIFDVLQIAGKWDSNASVSDSKACAFTPALILYLSDT